MGNSDTHNTGFSGRINTVYGWINYTVNHRSHNSYFCWTLLLSKSYNMNSILNNDCLKQMKKMKTGMFDVVVTSPPYNLNNSTGSGMKLGSRGSALWPNSSLRRDGYQDYKDNMPQDEYVAWQKDCLAEMLRLIKPTGAIFYNHKWRTQNGLIQDRQDIVGDFPVRQIIIWSRGNGFNFNDGYFLPTYEVIYLICGKEFKLKPKANTIGDVWRISPELNTEHPAPFPVELVDKILTSCPGNLVLDPFFGSGTVGVSAVKNGWQYVGIEKSQEYCQMADERIKNQTKPLL